MTKLIAEGEQRELRRIQVTLIELRIYSEIFSNIAICVGSVVTLFALGSWMRQRRFEIRNEFMQSIESLVSRIYSNHRRVLSKSRAIDSVLGTNKNSKELTKLLDELDELLSDLSNLNSEFAIIIGGLLSISSKSAIEQWFTFHDVSEKFLSSARKALDSDDEYTFEQLNEFLVSDLGHEFATAYVGSLLASKLERTKSPPIFVSVDIGKIMRKYKKTVKPTS